MHVRHPWVVVLRESRPTVMPLTSALLVSDPAGSLDRWSQCSLAIKIQGTMWQVCSSLVLDQINGSFLISHFLRSRHDSPTICIVSHCRLHHLPFSELKVIEEGEPLLALRLYKLLAHLMARRQEVTVEQLATLHSIMSAAPLKTPRRVPRDKM